MRGLAGKVVLVTGAAAGIGRATAARFYEEGASLILVDVVPLSETDLATQFVDRMIYVQGDVTTAETVAKLKEHAEQGGLDVVVNNAGITRDATLHKMTMEQWDQVISVNLTGVFRVAQMAAQIMRDKKGGVILNAASVVAHYGNFGQTNYVATKAGVIGMTKTMAKELAKFGVRVNAVAPGFIETEMVKKMPEKVLGMMREKTPLGRLGTPADIAAAYAFLASDDAAFITGTCLNADGGVVLG